jgi:hypothetical protein
MDNTKEKPITTVGVIIPVEWEESGKPVSFALSSYEEKEYLIDVRTELGKQLSTIEKQKVRVNGILGRVVNNRRMILVNSYEQLSSSSHF